MTEFYITGGTIPPDAPSYIPRYADQELLAALERGEICYVLNARQMGKSSLCIRTRAALEKSGVRTAFLDLQKFGSSATAEQWYRALLERVGNDLKLRPAFLTYWRDQAELPPLTRLFGALRDVALEQLPENLVVFLDEIDVVRDLSFSTDEFFAAIRECHNARADDPLYQRLTFCIIGTVAPTDLIREVRLSPFNIGTRIRLADFTRTEAAPLATPLPDGTRTLDRVLWWTSGHPYLTQRLCAELTRAQSSDADTMVARLFFAKSDSDVDENIKNVRNGILRMGGEGTGFDRTDVLQRYGEVVSGKRVIDDDTDGVCTALRLSGLVTSTEGLLRPRNRVYARLFDLAWVRNHLPDAELRRQKAAVARARWQIGSIAAAVLLCMGTLTAWAVRNANRADTNALLAQRREQDALASAAAERRAKTEADTQRTKAQAATRKAQQQTALALQARNQAQAANTKTQQALQAESAAKQAASQSAQQAQRQAQRAQKEAFAKTLALAQASKLGYINAINLAHREIEAHHFPQAEQLLAATRTSPERGYEWEYLNGLCHQELRRFERGPFALSPDGRQAVIGDAKGILLIDTETGNVRKRISAGLSHYLYFFADGRRVLSELTILGEGSHLTLFIHDIHSGQVVGTLKEPVATKYAQQQFEISRDERYLAVSRDQSVAVWDLQTKRAVAEIPVATELNRMALSPDGRRIAIEEEAKFSQVNPPGFPVPDQPGFGKISIWDIATRKQVCRIGRWEGHSAGATAGLRFTPDGKSLWVQGRQEVALLDAETGRARPGWPRDAALSTLSHDGRQVAANIAGACQLLSTTGAVVRIIPFSEEVTALQFSQDDTRLLVACAQGEIYLLDGAGKQVFLGHSDSSLMVSLTPNEPRLRMKLIPDGTRLLSQAETIRLWSVPAAPGKTTFRIATSSANRTHFLPDGNRLLIGGDSRLDLLDLTTGKSTPLAQGTVGQIRELAVSPDGQHVALLEQKQNDFVQRDIPTTRLNLYSLLPGGGLSAPRLIVRGDVKDIQFAEDGENILGIDRGKVFRWHVRTGTMRPVPPGKGEVHDLAPGGRYLLALPQHPGESAELRETETGRLCARVPLSGIYRFEMISARGDRIAAVLDNKEVVIYAGTTGRIVSRLIGHSSEVLSSAFSPDARRIATASTDGTVRLWDVETGRVLVMLKQSPGEFVDGLAFSPNGARLITTQNGHLERGIPTTFLREVSELTVWQKPSARLLIRREQGAVAEAQLVAAVQTGNPTQVIAVAERARRLDLDIAKPFILNIAEARLVLGNLREARRGFDSLVSSYPQKENPWATALPGLIEKELGAYRQQTLTQLHLASRLSDELQSAIPVRRAALAPRLLDDYALALALGKRAVEEAERRSAPKADDDMLFFSYGAILLRAGKTDEAIVQLERAAKLKPDRVWPMLFLSLAYGEKGDKAAVRQWFEKSDAWRKERMDQEFPGPSNWAARLQVLLLWREAKQALEIQ